MNRLRERGAEFKITAKCHVTQIIKYKLNTQFMNGKTQRINPDINIRIYWVLGGARNEFNSASYKNVFVKKI